MLCSRSEKPRILMRAQAAMIIRHHGQRGATVIEYALIAGLIAVAVVAAVTLVGERAQGSLERTASEVQAAANK